MLRTKGEVTDFVQMLVNHEWLTSDEPLTDALLCWEDGFINFAMVLDDIGGSDENEVERAFRRVADLVNDGGYRDWLVHEADRPTRWMSAQARDLAF